MKAIYSSAKKWLILHWRGLLSSVLIATLAVFTLSLQLNTVIDGQNKFEAEVLSRISSTPDPTFRAVNATYLIPASLVGKALNNSLYGARIVSVVYVLISTALLFFIVKKFFNIRMASIASLLFITSSWVLAISHQATPLSLLILSPLIVLAALTWNTKTKKYKSISYMALAAALAIVAYTPYMLWLVLVSIIVFLLLSKDTFKYYKRSNIIIAGAIYLIILSPLILSLSKYPGQIKELLGIPLSFPSLGEYLARSIDMLSSLFIVALPLPELHLGRLPILDIFSAVMFLLGIYYFSKKIKKRQSVMLFSSIAILYAILPLSPLYQFNMTILLPFIYIFVIAGIVELLNQWYLYFPRNPWARYFGISLIIVAIALSTFYNLSRYYIAWPNAPETISVYMVKSKE